MDVIKDKDAIWDTDNYEVILLPATIYHMLTNGFQSKMRFKYPQIEKADDATSYGDLRRLGTNLTVDVGDGRKVCLMYCLSYPYSNKVFVDYTSLDKCLMLAATEFSGKKMMMTAPCMSKYDGNANRRRAMGILEKRLGNEDLTVYDYKIRARAEELKAANRRITDNDLGPQRKEILKKLYLTN